MTARRRARTEPSRPPSGEIGPGGRQAWERPAQIVDIDLAFSIGFHVRWGGSCLGPRRESSMRRVLLASLLLNGVFAVAFFSKIGPAHAGGPLGNGDVNGDGVIDISDAVYLLSSLFTGGPAPVAIQCPAPTVKGLPATGQTKCYGGVEGQIWREVPCGQAACQGQDAQYATGCPIGGPDASGRFVDHGDGTVTDTCTGLMWQKETADVNGSGAIETDFPGDRLAWCDA